MLRLGLPRACPAPAPHPPRPRTHAHPTPRAQGQASPAGPFLQGAELSAVDCAVLPWLLRANVVHHYR